MAPKESRIPAVAHNPISSVSVLDGDVNTSKIPGYKQSQLRAHGSVSRMQNNIPAPGQIKLSFGQASPSDAADHSTSAKCAKNNWKEICTKTNPQAVQTIEVRAVGGTVEMDQEDPEGSKILIAGAHMQEGSSCQIGKMGKPTRLPSRALCKMSRISSEANATAKKSRLVLPSGATGVHKCSVEVPPAKCEKLDPDVLDVNTPQAVLVANPKQMALAVPSSEARDTIITLQPGAESAPLRQCEELMVPVLSHDTKDEENRLPSPRLHHAFDEVGAQECRAVGPAAKRSSFYVPSTSTRFILVCHAGAFECRKSSHAMGRN